MTAATAPATKHRIESIDILRGFVMLIMAIDHVRDVMHLGTPEPTDLTVTTPILFFTRWITHFCAPTFVLLSGVSAFIAGTRRTKSQLSNFLLKRGIWLVAVEVIVINFAMTLNPLHNVIILQVIWAIGASMILLGLLVRIKASLTLIGAIGVIIFFGHNVLDILNPGAIGNTFAWKLLLSATGFNGFIAINHNHFLVIAYALLPWTGIMLIGYVFGSLYNSAVTAITRRKTLLLSGIGLLLVFFVFRAFNIYGDPSPWAVQKTIPLSIISFFNVSKYPPSLLYGSMTIGTALVLLSLIENWKSRFTSIVIVYGNVPFFYYVCHWFLIQFIHIILFFAMGFTTSQIISPNNPFFFSADNFGVNLAGVYGIWILVIFLLYWPCRWFSKYKKTHHQWWLSYL